MDGVEENVELDGEILEGKRGDPNAAPKPKKEKKEPNKEGDEEAEDDNFLDDDDMDDNMKSVVQEYKDEGDPEMGAHDEAEEVTLLRPTLFVAPATNRPCFLLLFLLDRRTRKGQAVLMRRGIGRTTKARSINS